MKEQIERKELALPIQVNLAAGFPHHTAARSPELLSPWSPDFPKNLALFRGQFDLEGKGMEGKEFNQPLPSFSSTLVESHLRAALNQEILPGAPDSKMNFQPSSWGEPCRRCCLIWYHQDSEKPHDFLRKDCRQP